MGLWKGTSEEFLIRQGWEKKQDEYLLNIIYMTNVNGGIAQARIDR